MNAGFRILVVDDDETFRDSLVARLKNEGYEVTGSPSATVETAIEAVKREAYAGPETPAPPAATPALPYPGVKSLEESERILILRAMKALRGNKSHVARALGISRKQLYVKLTAYGTHAPKEL